MAYDYIIIGSGHNSLVAAGYLAKAGNSVCVLEGSERIGGCTVTEEIIPGHKVSSVSYAFSLFSPEIIKDFDLKKKGLQILKRPIHSYTPDLDGYGLAMGDTELTCKEIARYSKRDVNGYALYCHHVNAILSNIDNLIDEIPPTIETNGRQLKALEKLKNLSKLYKINKNTSKISNGNLIKDTVELLTGSASSIIDRFIEKDPLKVTLATDGIIGSMISPSQSGSGYVLLHHVMGEAGGEKGVWGYVEGGMGMLSNILACFATSHGAKILAAHKVTEIATEKGRAVGVVANGNSFIAKKGVISGANITDTEFLLDFDGKMHLPTSYSLDISNIEYEAACSKINFALDKLPEFKNGSTCDRSNLNLLTGTVHIPSRLEDVENSFQEAFQGRPSHEKPILEMTFPSTLDDTLAPKGKHVMSCLVQYTPYELNMEGETWDTYRDTYADRCMDVIEDHAPGFKQSVLGRQIITPLDLERDYGLRRGDIFHGVMKPSQMLSMRPVAGWSDHKTPIKGLYLCGSCCHPGGGVTGIPGKNAAIVALKNQ